MKKYYQNTALSIISFLFISLAIPGSIQSQNIFIDFDKKQLSLDQYKIFKRIQDDSVTIDLRIVKVNMNLFKENNSINLNLFSDKNVSIQ